MNFLEAVASGRRFRRPSNTKGFYYFYNKGGFLMCSQEKMGDMEKYEVVAQTGVTREEILANDWQLEPATININAIQFYKAAKEVLDDRQDADTENTLIIKLAKKLGLE